MARQPLQQKEGGAQARPDRLSPELQAVITLAVDVALAARVRPHSSSRAHISARDDGAQLDERTGPHEGTETGRGAVQEMAVEVTSLAPLQGSCC